MKNLVLLVTLLLVVSTTGCGTAHVGIDRGQPVVIEEDGLPPVTYQNGRLFGPGLGIVPEPQQRVIQLPAPTPPPVIYYQEQPIEEVVPMIPVPPKVSPKLKGRVEIRCSRGHVIGWTELEGGAGSKSTTSIPLYCNQCQRWQQPRSPAQIQLQEMKQEKREEFQELRPRRGGLLTQVPGQLSFPPKPADHSFQASYHGGGGDYDKQYHEHHDQSWSFVPTPHGPQITDFRRSDDIDKSESYRAPEPYIYPFSYGAYGSSYGRTGYGGGVTRYTPYEQGGTRYIPR